MSVKPFAGWPEEALAWFAGLEANNDRAWFQANRSTYDDAVRGPLESFLAEVEGEFGEGRVFRPNRDTRFSKDKSPYKLQLAATVPHEASGGSWYVQLTREGLFAGAGVYHPENRRLASIRAAIADDRRGAALERVIERLEAGGLELLDEGSLKRAPKGYAADHPRIGLLRLVNVAAGRSDPPRRWLHTAEAGTRITATWRSATPLLDWLASAG